jgi:hypothetical protein
LTTDGDQQPVCHHCGGTVRTEIEFYDSPGMPVKFHFQCTECDKEGYFRDNRQPPHRGIFS